MQRTKTVQKSFAHEVSTRSPFMIKCGQFIIWLQLSILASFSTPNGTVRVVILDLSKLLAKVTISLHRAKYFFFQ